MLLYRKVIKKSASGNELVQPPFNWHLVGKTASLKYSLCVKLKLISFLRHSVTAGILSTIKEIPHEKEMLTLDRWYYVISGYD